MTAILNGLWQGMLLGIVIWGVMKVIPGINAATRHLLWWMSLAAVLILPFAGMVGVPAAAARPVSLSLGMVVVKADEAMPVPGGAVKPENAGVEARPTVKAVADPKPWEPMQVSAWPWWWVLAGIWAGLSMGLAVRLVRSFCWMERVRAGAAAAPARLQARLREMQRNAGVRRGAALKVSAEVMAPVVLGLAQPVIVIPANLAESMPEGDFDHVVLHELAHLARYDDWTNLLQRIIEVLLPIQPAVMFIGRQIGLEREAACDDWVVGVTGEAKPYAAALTRVAELTMWSRSGILASGAIGRPSQLYGRVARLVGRRRFVTPRVSYVLAGLGVTVVAMLVVLAMHAPRVIAVAQVGPETGPEKVAGAGGGAAATLPAGKAVGAGTTKWISPLEFEQSQTFAVRAGEKLIVDVDRGNVHVTTWDKEQVGIVVKQKGRSNAELKQFLDHHTTTMSQDPGVVQLNAKGDAWLSTASLQVEIDYEIQVPVKFDASVKDGMGNVDVTRLTGKLDVETGMGNVKLTSTTGTARAHSGAGNVDANQSAGTLTLSVGQGNVGIGQFGGDWVKAETGMGNVTADLSSGPKGDCRLQTSMGNVTVKLVGTAAVNMHASTAMGTVNSQFAEGANNGGGPTVNVESKMGNVRVAKQ